MRKIRLCVCFYLLVLSLPAAGRAGEAYPQVQVVARVNGQIFTYISEPKIEELKHDIQTEVAKALEESLSFPCMEWVAGERGSKAKTRARLYVDLSQRNPVFSWIDLSFSGAVEDSQPVHLLTISGITATWDRSWSKRNLKRLSDIVLRETKPQLQKQELRETFDSVFIANIPIAYSIKVDHAGQRIVAPINARRLNLVPETLLKLDLVAALCPPDPAGWCRIDLRSDGPGGHDLRCRLAENCCHQEGWSPGFADRLEARKPGTVKLYLGERHQHCKFGPDNCPGPDKDGKDIHRYPGSTP